MLCFPNQCWSWLVWHSNLLWNEVSEVPNVFTHSITDTYRYAPLPWRNENASVKPFCWHLMLLCQVTRLSVCSCFGAILTRCRSLIQMLASNHTLSCVAAAHMKFVHPIILLAVNWLIAHASCISMVSHWDPWHPGPLRKSASSMPLSSSHRMWRHICQLSEGTEGKMDRRWLLSSGKEQWLNNREVCWINCIILRSHFCAQWLPWCSNVQDNSTTELCDLFVLSDREEDKPKAGDDTSN